MKEVRQTKMPELSPVKPAKVMARRTGERSEPGRSGVTSAGVYHQGPLPVSVLSAAALTKPFSSTPAWRNARRSLSIRLSRTRQARQAHEDIVVYPVAELLQADIHHIAVTLGHIRLGLGYRLVRRPSRAKAVAGLGARGKHRRLRRTPAGFTALALDGYGLRDLLPARPASPASYPVSVRQVAAVNGKAIGNHSWQFKRDPLGSKNDDISL